MDIIGLIIIGVLTTVGFIGVVIHSNEDKD